jgi:hypothetical protein
VCFAVYAHGRVQKPRRAGISPRLGHTPSLPDVDARPSPDRGAPRAYFRFLVTCLTAGFLAGALRFVVAGALRFTILRGLTG